MRKRIIPLLVCAFLHLLAAEAKSSSQSIEIDLATIDKQVQSLGLNLLVEISKDLSTEVVEATFKFRFRDQNKTPVFFFFPGVSDPVEFERITLNEKVLSPTEIHVGRHPIYGNTIFILPPRAFENISGDISLRVRGPQKKNEKAHITHWGTWHPYLLSYDHAVPISAEIRTGANWNVVCSSELEEERVVGDQKISRWNSQRPLGWMFLTVGKYRNRVIQNSSLAFTIYWPENHGEFDPDEVAKYPLAMLDFYERLLGPSNIKTYRLVEFPEKRLNNLSVNGLIAITLGSYYAIQENKSYLEAVMSHEIAHYWWGGTVYASGEGARWMSEAFAEYSRYLFEKSHGIDPLSWRFRNLIMLSQFADQNPPIIWAKETYQQDETVYYQKGTFVLYMLESLIGSQTFENLLKEFVQRNRSAKTSIVDFVRLVNRTTGSDYSWFFNQWLRQPTGPQLELGRIRATRSSKGYALSGSIVQEEPAYKLDLIVRVVYANEDHSDFNVRVSRRENRFNLRLRGKPLKVILDPESKTFKWFRKELLPMDFAQVNADLEKNPKIAFGSAESFTQNPEQIANLQKWFKDNFKNIELVPSDREDANMVLFGEQAADYRLKHNLASLSSAETSLLRVFADRDPRSPDRFVLGIEGTAPDSWPYLIPQGLPYCYVEFRNGGINKLQVPSLPAIERELR